MQRLNYEDSCRRLQKDYIGEGVIPPMPNHLPQQDDEGSLGVSFFRTFIGEGDDLDNLTLPHTFFGRSEVNDATFRNTDFNGSNFCWNDFINVSFENADLSNSDIRCSVFKNVSFKNADLSSCDLRGSIFENCDFTMAILTKAVITRGQARKMELSKEQKQSAVIRWFAGDRPLGG